MTQPSLYVIFHESPESLSVEAITVHQLWIGDQFAAHDEGDMLSALLALYQFGRAEDSLHPIMVVVGDRYAFHRELAAWYGDTLLSPEVRDSVQEILGWHHPLGDRPDETSSRAVWQYIKDSSGASLLDSMTPQEFVQWIACGGYPARIQPLASDEPTPGFSDGAIIVDPLTEQAFVLQPA